MLDGGMKFKVLAEEEWQPEGSVDGGAVNESASVADISQSGVDMCNPILERMRRRRAPVSQYATKVDVFGDLKAVVKPLQQFEKGEMGMEELFKAVSGARERVLKMGGGFMVGDMLRPQIIEGKLVPSFFHQQVAAILARRGEEIDAKMAAAKVMPDSGSDSGTMVGFNPDSVDTQVMAKAGSGSETHKQYLDLAARPRTLDSATAERLASLKDLPPDFPEEGYFQADIHGREVNFKIFVRAAGGKVVAKFEFEGLPFTAESQISRVGDDIERGRWVPYEDVYAPKRYGKVDMPMHVLQGIDDYLERFLGNLCDAVEALQSESVADRVGRFVREVLDGDELLDNGLSEA